jgi:arginine decarboxylase
MIVPNKMFFTKGVGRHKEKLISFEIALREARIQAYNIVKVSSIVPPFCEQVSLRIADTLMKHGQILFCVLSENSTDEQDRLISASIGIAQPSDRRFYGYLSEHHDFGLEESKAGIYAEDLAAYMLATTMGINLGLELDTDSIWDEHKQEYRFGDDIVVHPFNVTQVAHGKKYMWTTVLAAAVLLEVKEE